MDVLFAIFIFFPIDKVIASNISNDEDDRTFTVVFDTNDTEHIVIHDRKISRPLYFGLEAVDGRFPFMVYLIIDLFRQEQKKFSSCSGSLIKLDTILTTAHCIDRMIPRQVIVVAGQVNISDFVNFRLRNSRKERYNSKMLQESIASRLILHPKYGKRYDVGIVKIPKPFRKSTYVNTIQYETDEYHGDDVCFVIGFGRDNLSDTGVLRYFITTVVQNNVVKCDPKGVNQNQFYCIDEEISTGCFGGLGGPLVCNSKVYGVISGSEILTYGKGWCSAPTKMLIYKLSHYKTKERFSPQNARELQSKSCKFLPQIYIFVTLVLLFL